MAKVETVLPEAQIISLDVLEYLIAQSARCVVRRGNLAWNNRVALLDTISGAPAITRVGQPDGSLWRRVSSAIGAVQATYMQEPGWNVGNDYSADPDAALLPLLFQFSLEIKRTGALVANAPACVGLIGNTPNDPTINGRPCYLLHSIAGENGGRWTVYNRSRDAAAIVKTDTGVDPTTAHEVVLTYRDTTNPYIALAIDGVEVDRQTGIANVPQYPAVLESWSIGAWNGFSAGGAGGQVDFWRNARLKITEQPGYPS